VSLSLFRKTRQRRERMTETALLLVRHQKICARAPVGHPPSHSPFECADFVLRPSAFMQSPLFSSAATLKALIFQVVAIHSLISDIYALGITFSSSPYLPPLSADRALSSPLIFIPPLCSHTPLHLPLSQASLSRSAESPTLLSIQVICYRPPNHSLLFPSVPYPHCMT
jgi:hypothetical protein